MVDRVRPKAFQQPAAQCMVESPKRSTTFSYMHHHRTCFVLRPEEPIETFHSNGSPFSDTLTYQWDPSCERLTLVTLAHWQELMSNLSVKAGWGRWWTVPFYPSISDTISTSYPFWCAKTLELDIKSPGYLNQPEGIRIAAIMCVGAGHLKPFVIPNWLGVYQHKVPIPATG